MARLTMLEKRQLETLLRMDGGYVLDFSNRTFEEFVRESAGRAIYDSRYEYRSGSKANRLRGFWQVESGVVVGTLLDDMIRYGVATNQIIEGAIAYRQCYGIIADLLEDSSVAELDVFAAISDERAFETLTSAVREAIERDEPEAALDRLHTFVVKYVRTLCTQHGINVTPDKPLHSLFGEYVRALKAGGHIESEMGIRILKSSISILEAFNEVRNNRTLAHDNELLHHDEALLILSHVASSVSFLRSVENKLKKEQLRMVPAQI